jgi:hypothetical protein
MKFDAKEFEHFVDERSLRRGYRLFEKGMPELEKSGSLAYTFHVAGHNLHIRKKGDKILSYQCDCGKHGSCEHLGAAMFYFQQHALGIHPKNVHSKLSHAAPLQSPNKKNAQGRQKSLYDSCSAKLCTILKPYFAEGKLDAAMLSELHSQLNAFLANAAHHKEDQLCVWLAAYAECAPLFSLRFTADESALRQWYATLESRLQKCFEGRLTAAGRDAWQMATLRSLRSDKCLDSKSYEFLLPRYLQSHPSKSGIELLTQLVTKRKLKTGYLRRINHLLIAEIQLYLRANGNGTLPFRLRKFPAECVLAHASLELCAGKVDRAFSRLEQALGPVKEHQPEAWQEYTVLLIQKASICQRKELEIRLRKQSLLQAMFIRQEDLDLLLKLFPINKRQGVIESLLSEMKQPGAVNTFDKIAALLLANNKLDELMREMSGQDLRFNLLNEVAMKKLKSCDEKFLRSYITQLGKALESSGSLQHQVRLFDFSKEFLQQLPTALADKAAEWLYNQFPQHQRLGAHIRSFFRFSRIHLN